MDLKLLDEYKARLFGFEPKDTSEADALKVIAEAHPRWSEAEVKGHLKEAIAAGAFGAAAAMPKESEG